MLTRFLPLSPRLARLWIALLASAAFALAVSLFIEVGSSSTDENVFTTPPSAVYLTGRVPVTPVGGAPLPPAMPIGGAPLPPATPVDTLLPGDIITAIDGERVLTVADFGARTSGRPAGSRVTVRARRTAQAMSVSGQAEASVLASAAIRDIAHGALVTGVTTGGASDRAGMQVGDVIVRIAGQGFTTIFEADARMRSGGAGRAYTYDVIRDGREVRLDVTLARFGLQILVFVAMLTGLTLMAFGTWMGLVRPQFLGARWLAYAWIPFGYAVATLFAARGPQGGQTLLQAVRALSLIVSIVFGFAGLFWSAAHFPVAWPRLQRARWVGMVLYGLGVATFVATAGLNNLGLVAGHRRYFGVRDDRPDRLAPIAPARVRAR